MIRLQVKPQVSPPDTTYIFGNIKDDTGANDGTPVEVLTCADQHQFFEMLMYLNQQSAATIKGNVPGSGLVPNDLPDNAVNGWQLPFALLKIIDQLINYYLSLAVTWVNATYASGWSDVSVPLAYTKDIIGRVTLRGDAANSAIASLPLTITTLPSGFRPSTDIRVPVILVDATATTSCVGLLHIAASSGIVALQVSSSAITNGHTIYVYGLDLSFQTT